MMAVRWAAGIGLLMAAALAPQPAAAQLSAGPIQQLVASANYTTSPVKGSDVAWDPVHRVYLAVLGCYNSCPYGQVYGLFIDTTSVPVGLPFSIKTGALGGHFPRATYSQHVNGGQGGFLVVWNEENSGGNQLRTRVIAYSNGTGVKIGSENTIHGTAYSWLESAAAVAYSPVSQRFLVAWRVYPSVPGIQITARLVDINGAAVGGLIKLSAGFGRDPGVAWNSITNEFGVSFGNENGSGTVGFMGFAVVNPSTGTFVRNSFPSIAGFSYVTDLAFNPNTNRFVMTWHQQPGGSPEVWVAEMATDASILAQGLITRSWPAYDALAVSFNPSSGTFLLTSLRDSSDNIDGAELNSRGYRAGQIVNLGPGVAGKYVRAAAAIDDARWALTFSDGFRSLKSFAVMTTSTNGGSVGSYGGPPPSRICISAQPIWDWRVQPPAPGPTGNCVNGLTGPVMLAPTSPATPIPVPAPPELGPPTPPPHSGCTSIKPGPKWICVNGDWLPPRAPEPDPEEWPVLAGLSAAQVIPAGHDASHRHGPAAVAEFLSHQK